MPEPKAGARDSPAPPDIDEAGVDRAQIRAMLDLSPEDRLRVVEEFVESVGVIRRSGSRGPRHEVSAGGIWTIANPVSLR
jgi:hypothetical protein